MHQYLHPRPQKGASAGVSGLSTPSNRTPPRTPPAARELRKHYLSCLCTSISTFSAKRERQERSSTHLRLVCAATPCSRCIAPRCVMPTCSAGPSGHWLNAKEQKRLQILAQWRRGMQSAGAQGQLSRPKPPKPIHMMVHYGCWELGDAPYAAAACLVVAACCRPSKLPDKSSPHQTCGRTTATGQPNALRCIACYQAPPTNGLPAGNTLFAPYTQLHKSRNC